MLGIAIALIAGLGFASYIQSRNAHRQAFDAWRHQAPQEHKSDE